MGDGCDHWVPSSFLGCDILLSDSGIMDLSVEPTRKTMSADVRPYDPINDNMDSCSWILLHYRQRKSTLETSFVPQRQNDDVSIKFCDRQAAKIS